jgi:hypothetical protein
MTDFRLFQSHLLAQSGSNYSQNGRLFCISTAALITNILLTSWGNEMILTEKLQKGI